MFVFVSLSVAFFIMRFFAFVLQLAICNCLLLRNQIHIHEDLSYVDLSHLVQLVANRLLEGNPGTPGDLAFLSELKHNHPLLARLPPHHFVFNPKVNTQQ